MHQHIKFQHSRAKHSRVIDDLANFTGSFIWGQYRHAEFSQFGGPNYFKFESYIEQSFAHFKFQI